MWAWKNAKDLLGEPNNIAKEIKLNLKTILTFAIIYLLSFAHIAIIEFGLRVDYESTHHVVTFEQTIEALE